VADFIANKLLLQQSGAVKWSERVSPLAIIVGAFIVPPLGLILVPFIAVLAMELLHRKSLQEAARLAGITVVSFLTSTLAKAVMQVGIIVVFILSVIF